MEENTQHYGEVDGLLHDSTDLILKPEEHDINGILIDTEEAGHNTALFL